MKILVTGGTGLVGNALKHICDDNSEYIFMSSKDANLINYDETLRYFKNIKPDQIIHLAANVGGLYKNIQSNVEMFENNIYINTNVIKCAYKVGVTTLVACLSTCVYPDIIKYPITEDQFHNGEPNKSNFGYSYSKRMLEVQCRAYNEQYKIKYTCIIPTNIYGPHDNFSLRDSHVIPGLIHKFFLAKKENKQIILPGSGLAVRQFVYSLDVAQYILNILKSEHLKKTVYNICEDSHYEISIKQIVEIISECMEYDNYIFESEEICKNDGQIKKTADNTSFKSEFSLIHNDLKNNIKKTINWFESNYDEIRC